MKRFYLFIVVAILGFLYACVNDDNNPSPNNEPDSKNQIGYSIPLQDALDELEEILNATNADQTTTRANGEKRTIKNVEVVYGDGYSHTTRSSDADSLFYIVNFENDKGYALLGADKRADGVIALVDKGSLTADQFISPPDIDATNGSQALYSLIKEYVSNSISTYNEDLTAKAANRWYGFWVYDYGLISPLLGTQWHQREPYNYYCPEINGEKCVAGCVAITLAQIYAFNKQNYNFGPDKISGYTIDWNGVIADINEPGTNSFAVATLIRAVGAAVGMDYGIDASSSNIDKACTALKQAGYKSPKSVSYSADMVKTMVYDRVAPTYMRGAAYSSNGTLWGGHAWVVDGYERYSRLIYEGPVGMVSKVVGTDYKHLVHCNFGWENGLSNGYYASDIFNLLEGAERPDSNTGTTDIVSWKDKKLIQYQR